MSHVESKDGKQYWIDSSEILYIEQINNFEEQDETDASESVEYSTIIIHFTHRRDLEETFDVNEINDLLSNFE